MRKTERGVSLIGLLFWGIILAFFAILATKLTPEYITYFKIKQGIKAVAADSTDKSIPELRAAFAKHMEVDHISTITPADLLITKDGYGVSISFAYESVVPLFYNVSLLIDFEGSARGKG